MFDGKTIVQSTGITVLAGALLLTGCVAASSARRSVIPAPERRSAARLA